MGYCTIEIHPLFEQKYDQLPDEAFELVISLIDTLSSCAAELQPLNEKGLRVIKSFHGWVHPNGTAIPPIRIFYQLSKDGKSAVLLWIDTYEPTGVAEIDYDGLSDLGRDFVPPTRFRRRASGSR